MAADSGGEDVEREAKSGDLVGEAGEGASGGGVVSVLFDGCTKRRVAVEGGAAEAGVGGDGGEGDWLAVAVEFGAGAFDPVEGAGGGHPVWALVIRVSSRAMRRWWRSVSAIQPRCSASRASASASTRWAARMGSELGSVWKLGQCSQILA